MSLEQAYTLQNQRRNSDPLERGLSAGAAAYRGEPRGFDMEALRSSVNQNLRQAELQRQIAANNAAKRVSGLYGNTGTSANAYDYLHGKTSYPVDRKSTRLNSSH